MSELFYLDSDNILNRGGVANDNTGDTLRTAALKINTNFQHLDSAVNSVVNTLDTHDSAAVLGQINATVNQSYVDALDTHDSAAVQGQIDATIALTDTHDSAAVLGQINAVNAADVTFGSDITVSGIGKPNTVTISGNGAQTYTLTDGNTATLTTDSDKTITFGGVASSIIGSGFSMMIKNSDADSDRTITFQAEAGKSVKFNTDNTLTINANDFGVASVLVFDANTILVTATSLDSSLTF